MLNVQDLERRWLKYKIKSKATIIAPVIGTSVLLIVVTIYLLSNQENVEENTTLQTLEKRDIKEVQETKVKEPLVEVAETTIPSEPVTTVEPPQAYQAQATSTLVLKPSLHFMDSIEDDISPYLEEESTPQALKRSISKPKTAISNQVDVQRKFTPNIQPAKTQTLVTRSIKQDNSDLKDVIKRFKKNKNPVLGLFIAKRYYDAGEYQKSYNYALITNEIDKNIEESWITFSKSLVKLGQKKLAINTLKSYLKTTKSTKATTLLQNIQSGEFK